MADRFGWRANGLARAKVGSLRGGRQGRLPANGFRAMGRNARPPGATHETRPALEPEHKTRLVRCVASHPNSASAMDGVSANRTLPTTPPHHPTHPHHPHRRSSAGRGSGTCSDYVAFAMKPIPTPRTCTPTDSGPGNPRCPPLLRVAPPRTRPRVPDANARCHLPDGLYTGATPSRGRSQTATRQSSVVSDPWQWLCLVVTSTCPSHESRGPRPVASPRQPVLGRGRSVGDCTRPPFSRDRSRPTGGVGFESIRGHREGRWAAVPAAVPAHNPPVDNAGVAVPDPTTFSSVGVFADRAADGAATGPDR